MPTTEWNAAVNELVDRYFAAAAAQRAEIAARLESVARDYPDEPSLQETLQAAQRDAPRATAQRLRQLFSAAVDRKERALVTPAAPDTTTPTEAAVADAAIADANCEWFPIDECRP